MQYTFIQNDQSEKKLNVLIQKYRKLLEIYTDLITKIENPKEASHYSKETHIFYLEIKSNVIRSLLKFLSLKETTDINKHQYDEFREIFTLSRDRDILDFLNTCLIEKKPKHDVTAGKQKLKPIILNCAINYRVTAIMNAASKYPFILESSTKMNIENQREVSNEESYEQFCNAVLAP